MARRISKRALEPAPADIHPPLPAPAAGNVVLVRDHRHAGRDYRAGETLHDLAPETIALLRRFGAIGGG